VMVPSKIDSPICGITMSVGMNPSLRHAGAKKNAPFQPDYKSQHSDQMHRVRHLRIPGAPSLARL
jgi:hypothetical protein